MSGPSAKHKIIIVLETFKHSRRPALLALPEANNVNYCPKTALVNFLKIRSAANGPLFTNERGIAISRYALLKVLKACINLAGLNEASFNTHSFRVGRASDLASNGDSGLMIRETGRWTSNAFMKYLRFEFFQLPEVH